MGSCHEQVLNPSAQEQSENEHTPDGDSLAEGTV
jgi:hypothetical protein